VAGALASHADSILEQLDPAGEATARALLLRLITPEGTRQVVNREEALAGLAPGAGDMMDRLIAARLVTVRRVRGVEGSEVVLELVHESLIHSWTTLSRWLEQGREDHAFLHEAGQAAEVWERRGRRADEVWQGDALADALRAARRCADDLPESVRRFLDAGRRRQSRRSLRIRLSLAAVALLMLVITASQVYLKRQADLQRQATAKQRDLARQHFGESQRESADAAEARGDMLQARAQLRGALESRDSTMARALWRRLKQSPVIWRKQLGGVAYAAAFTPDGRRVAAACQDRTIHLIDTQTTATRVLRGLTDQVFSLAISTDGAWLAAGTWSGKVWLYSLKDGRASYLEGHSEPVWAVAFSPDSARLASGSDDGTIRIWRPGEAKPAQVLKPGRGKVNGLDFSPDGLTLAAALDSGEVLLWGQKTGESPRPLRGPRGAVMAVAFCPGSGMLASAGNDGAVRLWDPAAGKVVRQLKGHEGSVLRVACGAGGRLLASAGLDQSLRLWGVADGLQLASLGMSATSIFGVVFHPDGRSLVSAGKDGGVTLWRAESNLRDERPDRGHGNAVEQLALIRGGRQIASAGADGSVRFWDLTSGAQIKVLHTEAERLDALAASPGGRYLAAAGSDRLVRLWLMDGSYRGRVVGSHWGDVSSAAFGASGDLLATGGVDWRVRLWHAKGASPARVMPGHQGQINDLSVSPDGKLLATGGEDRAVKIWGVQGGELRHVLEGHTAGVEGVAFSPDSGTVASTGGDGTVRLWDMAGGLGRVLWRQKRRANSLSFHPGGRLLGVPSADGNAYLVDITTGEGRPLRGHRAEVNSVRFTADGALAVTASDDGTVRPWEVSTGKPRWRAPLLSSAGPDLFSHQGLMRLGPKKARVITPERRWQVAVQKKAHLADESADGRAVCVATHGGRIELWDTAADGRIADFAAPRVMQVLAMDRRCVARTASAVILHDSAGSSRRLHGPARKILRDGTAGRLIILDGGTLQIKDLKGEQVASHKVDPGVVAAARIGDKILLGHTNGDLQVLDGGRGTPAFEQTPSSPVVALTPGPRKILVAGYANGAVGLWQVSNGERLDHARIHGPVVHLLVKGNRLYAASELGDQMQMDLKTLHSEYCEVLRDVWRQVPVEWKGGRPARREPLASHPCSLFRHR